MKRWLPVASAMFLTLIAFNPDLLAAAEKKQPDSEFTSIEDSPAFEQFLMRPKSELSKVLFLIERFGDQPVEIRYDHHYYTAEFSARVARWFLTRNYKKETAHQWIMKWCNRSVPGGNLIWVKLPSGKNRMAREVLLQELNDLEKVTEAVEKKTVSNEQSNADLGPVTINTENPVNPVSQSLQSQKGASTPIVVATKM